MAIVKMKRLSCIALAQQRNALIRGLTELGCVEIAEPEEVLEDPRWSELFQRQESALTERRAALAGVEAALAAITRYGGGKESPFAPRPAFSKEDFLRDDAGTRQAQETERQVSRSVAELEQARLETTRLEARRASLAPWRELEMPLNFSGTQHTRFGLWVCPQRTDTAALRAQMEAASLAAELLEVSQDRLQRYLLLIVHLEDEAAAAELLRPAGFSAVSFPDTGTTAARAMDETDRAIEECALRQEAARAAIAAAAESREVLERYADLLRTEVEEDRSAQRMVTDSQVLYFQGWVPAEKEEAACRFLRDCGCAFAARDPTEEEIPAVPVQLKNNPLTQPLNMVTNMYVLPAYDGLDPNPLMAPFFITFYGLMMADMGYGLLMLLGAWVILKKMHARGGMRDLGGLLGLCGISTFIWGALTGGFFGDFIPQIAKLVNPDSTLSLPALFTPLTDTLMILVGSLVLGVIQIFTGMAISVVKKVRDGHWQDALWEEGTWWAILIGAALAIAGIGNVGGVPLLLTVGGVMLLYGSTRNARGFGKVSSLVGAVYNGVTGYFSDTLSYARLMALMLAGSVIAQVFNTLGSVTGNVVLFVAVSLVGNLLNFALNLLGCYVHDLRLQCLEFFNRFYKEGGKPFSPLTVHTEYVDVL